MQPEQPASERLGADPKRWLDLYGDTLYRYAYARVRSEQLAEDLVQETLLAAWRARDSFQGRSSERTWRG
ncbi:MAG: sigma factor [Planctomycetota bacterium]